MIKIDKVSVLECYQCDHGNEACKDPFQESENVAGQTCGSDEDCLVFYFSVFYF